MVGANNGPENGGKILQGRIRWDEGYEGQQPLLQKNRAIGPTRNLDRVGYASSRDNRGKRG